MTRIKRDRAELRSKVTYTETLQAVCIFFSKGTINAYIASNCNYVLTKLLKVQFAPTIMKAHYLE